MRRTYGSVRRAGLLAAVILLPLMEGCRVLGRAPSTRTGPKQTVAGRESVPPVVRGRDTAAVPAAVRDSTAGVRTDSSRRDSLLRVPSPRDSSPGDSVSRDTVTRPAARQDSATTDSTRATPPVRKRKTPPATRECILDFAESPPETRLLYSRISEGVANTFIGGGFVGNCQGENNRLRADSAEQFQAAGIVNLYGNVSYTEPGKIQIVSTRATYFTREGRLYAEGGVTATQLETGSTFSGPSIEYYRALPPERPAPRMVAPMRSTMRVIEKDSTGRLLPPATIEANRFEDLGDSLLLAWGDVVVTRSRLVARSDSAAFDKVTEQARLIRGARIVNEDTAQRFTLVGDTVDLFSRSRRLERVTARHKATATSDQVVITSEAVDLRLREQQLEEAFAFGAGRSKASTAQQDVDADSLHLRLVDRRVREMQAVGDARTVGTPDSTKMRTTGKDILRGDRLLAFFDSTPPNPADTARQARVREIQALGNASSLFHVANSKGREAPPGINYVRGARIYVHFDTGAVRDVQVDSAASGVYVEAAPDSLADSTAAATRRPPGGSGNRRSPGRPAQRAPVQPPRRPPLPDAALRSEAVVPLSDRTISALRRWS